MIQFFRRMFSSRVGVVLAIAFVGLVGLAFALADINAPTGMFGGRGETVASVGDREVDAEQISQMMTRALQNAREQQPGMDMAALIDSGGIDEALDQFTQAYALAAFAEDHGILISKRLIDSAIASLPIFQGLTGEFDENTFRQVLTQQNITEEQVRQDLERQTVLRVILAPVSAAARVPEAVARPYARLLLEERSGQVAAVPSQAMPQGEPPTAAELNRYYQANLRNYTLPERRAVRYAVFTRDQLTVPAPTEEQVRAYYRENSDRYGGTETRTLRQIILPDEAQARAFYEAVRGGADFTAAAGERGFSEAATRVSGATRESFARTTSDAIAAAAFGAEEGALLEPVRSGLGWHVIRVAEVERRDATPLAQARPEIVQALREELANEALADFYLGIENAIDDGAAFEEIVDAQGLTIAATPLVAPNGNAPAQPDFRGGPYLPQVLEAAFTMDADEEPLLIPLEENRRYAMVDVTEVAPSAPQPLSAIRSLVARDFVLDRAARRAHRIAAAIAEQVNEGAALGEAIAAADIDLPPVQPARATRAAISQNIDEVPEALRLMFRMAENTAKLVRLPGNQGWLVVVLDAIRSDPEAVTPELVAATQQQFAQVTASEYAEQFVNAVLADYEVERDEEAIQALAERLTGRGT